MEHLRRISAAPGILLRQRVQLIIGVILQEADVRPRPEVQPRDAVQHGHLQIPGAVAQIVAVERAADALALQGVEVLQRVPLKLKVRQLRQVVEGLRQHHDDVGPHRRCLRRCAALRRGAVRGQDLVDPGQDILHIGFAVFLRALLGLEAAVPPEAQKQAVGVMAVGGVQSGIHIHLKGLSHCLGPRGGKQSHRQR